MSILVARGTWDFLATCVSIGVLHGTATKALSYDGHWPYLVRLRQGGIIAPPNPPAGIATLLTTRKTELVGIRLGGDNIGGASVAVRVGGTACKPSSRCVP